eukprot:1578424-Rhodomonas_salina.1
MEEEESRLEAALAAETKASESRLEAALAAETKRMLLWRMLGYALGYALAAETTALPYCHSVCCSAVSSVIA